MTRVLALTAALAATWAAGVADARVVASFARDRLAAPPVAAARVEVAPGRRGRLVVVPGETPRSGPGPLRRYAVEVEGGIRIDRDSFAARVHAVLGDRRGWGRGGRLAFKRVSAGRIDFRVALARPATTDRLCAPFVTRGTYSCANGGRAVLNLRRWRLGARAYRGDLDGYRTYLVGHEVGHLLGRVHRSCPSAGAKAPVMLQQTKGVGGCRPNPWPLRYER